MEGLPKFFCSKVRVSDDKAWTEEEGKFSEKPLLDKVRERIKEGVRKALEDNARLLKNSHCKLRDCELVVELEKGARPIFKRPYPIPEAFQEAVNNCCQEWLDNGWVKLLPPDQRNNWNSPLLAVKKVSGNKWLGDIRLCMDFRWVNALTLDPAFQKKNPNATFWKKLEFGSLNLFHLFQQGLFGNLEKITKKFRINQT